MQSPFNHPISSRRSPTGSVATTSLATTTSFLRSSAKPATHAFKARTATSAVTAPPEVVTRGGRDGRSRVIRERSKTLEELSGPDWGFTKPISWLDQVLVRGAKSTPAHRWPEEQRRLHGKLLSDHAPVEVRIG